MITKTLIAGLPLAAYGGMALFVLLAVQVLGGMRIIKMDLKLHRRLGLLILGLALLHGLFALAYFWG